VFCAALPFSWKEMSRVRGALSVIITIVVMAVVVWLILRLII
jgi:hypothetical protein